MSEQETIEPQLVPYGTNLTLRGLFDEACDAMRGAEKHRLLRAESICRGLCRALEMLDLGTNEQRTELDWLYKHHAIKRTKRSDDYDCVVKLIAPQYGRTNQNRYAKVLRWFRADQPGHGSDELASFIKKHGGIDETAKAAPKDLKSGSAAPKAAPPPDERLEAFKPFTQAGWETEKITVTFERDDSGCYHPVRVWPPAKKTKAEPEAVIA